MDFEDFIRSCWILKNACSLWILSKLGGEEKSEERLLLVPQEGHTTDRHRGGRRTTWTWTKSLSLSVCVCIDRIVLCRCEVVKSELKEKACGERESV